ncbi:MAG: hypothetical protein K9L99_05915 [Candidatus Omnitrophica bacterium]|nr:hypothetical protein [Candidatus Omnitrophota bacterium]MCF7917246.1 hypothetical protein [Candidatus Omnitrophota bacterium]
MKKIMKLMVIISFFVSLFSGLAYSEDISNLIYQGKIPLPSDAEEISGIASGMPNVVMYKTSFDKQDLFNFFNLHMENKGWTAEGDFANKLKNLGVSLERNLGGKKVDLRNNLSSVKTYRKDKSVIMLTAAAKSSSQPKQVFTLAYLDMGSKLPQIGEAKLPKSIPVYPGAKLITSAANNFVYRIKDGIKNIRSFYKENMIINGWRLSEETPIKVRSSESNISKKDFCKDCQTNNSKKNTGNILGEKNSFKTLYSYLVFTNKNGERCKVVISQVNIAGEGSYISQIVIRTFS